MVTTASQTRDVISFGPFRLVVNERLLTKEGVTLELGARTLDLLIALVSRPNEFLSKTELMALVWPDLTVSEGSLRFHVASLRKALGDGKNGARYISTLAGRGYCFVAPVSRTGELGNEHAAGIVDLPHADLPAPSRGWSGEPMTLSCSPLNWRRRALSPSLARAGLGKRPSPLPSCMI